MDHVPKTPNDGQDKQKKQRNLERLKNPTKDKGKQQTNAGGFEAQSAALRPGNQPGIAQQYAALRPGAKLTPLPRMPSPMQAPQQVDQPLVAQAPQRPQRAAPELPVAEQPLAAPVLSTKNEKKGMFGRSKAKTLSSGTANEVTKVKYDQGIGGGQQKRGFWKQGAMSGAADVVGIDKTPGQSQMGPSKKDPSKMVKKTLEKTTDTRLAARAVASSRLDKALGTNVIADEAFAEHDGQMGNVSATVAGRSLMQNKVDANGKLAGQDLAQVDAKDPAYQKSMADLGMLDYLSGQIDRHAGNIFYDPKSGQAKGIDNDLAFGQFDHQSNVGLGFGNALDALPKQIDADTAKVIRDMTVSQFRASIEGRPGDPEALHPAEVKKAVERFQKLKLHIAELQKKGALVQTWDDQTYADACNDPDGTYLGRHEQRTARPTNIETVTQVPKSPDKKKVA